jgi:hypothetical protein
LTLSKKCGYIIFVMINIDEFPQGLKALETVSKEPTKDMNRNHSIMLRFFKEGKTPNGYAVKANPEDLGQKKMM